MKDDRRFTEADVICLTETWLKLDQEFTRLNLNGFKFHHLARIQVYSNNDEHMRSLRNSKGGGVAFYLKQIDDENQIIHHSIQNIECIVVKFLKKKHSTGQCVSTAYFTRNHFFAISEIACRHIKITGR